MELEKCTLWLAEEWEFEGYIDNNDGGWNGWANPYFDKATAEKIYDEITMNQTDGYKWNYCEEKKEFNVTMETEEGTEWFDSCKLEIIDGMELYPVGNQNFCWQVLNTELDK